MILGMVPKIEDLQKASGFVCLSENTAKSAANQNSDVFKVKSPCLIGSIILNSHFLVKMKITPSFI